MVHVGYGTATSCGIGVGVTPIRIAIASFIVFSAQKVIQEIVWTLRDDKRKNRASVSNVHINTNEELFHRTIYKLLVNSQPRKQHKNCIKFEHKSTGRFPGKVRTASCHICNAMQDSP
jgi:hypothetical protein